MVPSPDDHPELLVVTNDRQIHAPDLSEDSFNLSHVIDPPARDPSRPLQLVGELPLRPMLLVPLVHVGHRILHSIAVHQTASSPSLPWVAERRHSQRMLRCPMPYRAGRL